MGWMVAVMLAAVVATTGPAWADAATRPTTTSAPQPASRPADENVNPPSDRTPQPRIRNLFLPDVQNDETPTLIEDPTLVVPAGGLVLTGLMAQGDRRQALLEDKEAGRSVVLAVGDRIGPWRVERVEITRLIVRKADGPSLVIELGGALDASLPPEEEGPPGAVGPLAPVDPSLESVAERMRRRARADRGGT